jgi:hypothetical protein
MGYLTLTSKTKFKEAIINLDYFGLDKEEVKECNNFLLNNGVSFRDCVSFHDCDDGNTFYNFKV